MPMDSNADHLIFVLYKATLYIASISIALKASYPTPTRHLVFDINNILIVVGSGVIITHDHAIVS